MVSESSEKKASNRVAVVWFKRDLRVQDHAPLSLALRAQQEGHVEAVLGVYCFEPTLLMQPDVSALHLSFVLECIRALRADLQALGIPLLVRHQNALDCFKSMHAKAPLTLFSHEETGNWASFQRDRQVHAWCAAAGVEWSESPSNAVVRRLKDRDRWSKQWLKRMQDEPLDAPVPCDEGALQKNEQWAERFFDARLQVPLNPVLNLPVKLLQGNPWPWSSHNAPARQIGGRSQALSHWQHFLKSGLSHYRKGMSSPLVAPDVCSRLSPYLAYGVLSIKEVVHWTWAARQVLQSAQTPSSKAALQGLQSFESRLHWHCHFIQKLESEPEMEFANVNPVFDGMRNEGELSEPETERLTLWAQGQTGVPMVDASMRMLQETGWINFRMRAMLMSFACHHLWLHWRMPAQVLACYFLDYEPGIHYPQAQMQSGVTGINTVRIYNPVKQALDQDPTGAFLRRWLPALQKLPVQHLAAPWLTPPMVQEACGCVVGQDFPKPMVDIDEAARDARDRLWSLTQFARQTGIAQQVYKKHGSRNPDREGRRKTAKRPSSHTPESKSISSAQQSLF